VRTRFVSALALERARHPDRSRDEVMVVVESSLRNRKLDFESFEVDEVFDSQFAAASFYRTVGLILNAHLSAVAPQDRDDVVRRAVAVARALRRYWMEPLASTHATRRREPRQEPTTGIEVFRTLVHRDERPVVPIGHVELSWNRDTKRFRGAFQLGLRLDRLLDIRRDEEERVFCYVVCLAQL